MNKVFLIGRLSKHPELVVCEKSLKSPKPVYCRFNLVVKRLASSDPKAIDVIRCVTWNRQAENLTKYLTKGSLIAVHGRLQVDVLPAANPQFPDTFIVEVHCEQIQFLETKASSQHRLQS